MLKKSDDAASEVYIYFNAAHVLVAPTIYFKTFRGPALPSDVISVPFQVSAVSEAVFRKLDAGIRCDTEVEFDKTTAAFFKEHKIKGWDALPRMFQHIVVRRINADSILVTCFEHRSGDGYVSENKALDIAASSTALENALGYCFDSLRKKSKSS